MSLRIGLVILIVSRVSFDTVYLNFKPLTLRLTRNYWKKFHPMDGWMFELFIDAQPQ